MSRATRNKLSPWIETLILNYGSPDGGSSSLQMKAHVIGVGQMSQSQVQGSDDPPGLLFLSDGVLQIPAILTASAWEHLQETEERECFTSLLNTTVFIQNYQLQFHMMPEQTKCRFFLSVGQLAATSAGPAKENTPCCTTLQSVRQKICKTWRSLLDQEGLGSQSQCGFDLTELLGEWRDDCLQTVLYDVRKRLITASNNLVNPQPSTSTSTSSSGTSWDVDRVTYKKEKCFNIPVNFLLIPEEEARQLQTPPNVKSRTQSEPYTDIADSEREFRGISEPLKTTHPSDDDDDDTEWKIKTPALVKLDCNVNENMSEDFPDEEIITRLNESEIQPLKNPWDIFPPPGDTSSSTEASPEPIQTGPHVHVFTSTQVVIHTSKVSEQSSKGEQSDILPYQKPANSGSLPITLSTSASTSVSPLEPFTKPASLSPDTEKQHTSLSTLEQDSQIFEMDVEKPAERKSRKAKRKRSDPPADSQEEEVEAEISTSPPSWLFDSNNSSSLEEGSRHQQGQITGMTLKKTPTIHIDGRPFSYSYQVSEKDLQDFSRFKVSESMLNWAVKYLVAPKENDDPKNLTATSNQASLDRMEVTSL